MSTLKLPILVFAFVLASLASPSVAIETTAKNAYVIDVSTGTIMLDKASSEAKPPASTSKLMTIALLFKALEEGKVSMDTTFKVSEKAWAMKGSKMFVELGSEVSVSDLLKGILVQSGNDACVVVAEGLAGTEDKFAEQMNAYAVELGLSDSSFGNASGWPHPKQLMSARDLAKLAYFLYKTYPQHWSQFSEPEFTYNKIKQANRNPLLGVVQGADGLKTGHTEAAGYNLVGSVERNGRRIVLVLMGMSSEAERASEAERIASWALNDFQASTEIKAGETIATAKTWMGNAPEINLTTPSDFTTLKPIGTTGTIQASALFEEPLVAPLEKGTQVGIVRVTQKNMPTYELPLVLAESLERGGFFSRFKQVVANSLPRAKGSMAEAIN